MGYSTDYNFSRNALYAMESGRLPLQLIKKDTIKYFAPKFFNILSKYTTVTNMKSFIEKTCSSLTYAYAIEESDEYDIESSYSIHSGFGRIPVKYYRYDPDGQYDSFKNGDYITSTHHHHGSNADKIKHFDLTLLGRIFDKESYMHKHFLRFLNILVPNATSEIAEKIINDSDLFVVDKKLDISEDFFKQYKKYKVTYFDWYKSGGRWKAGDLDTGIATLSAKDVFYIEKTGEKIRMSAARCASFDRLDLEVMIRFKEGKFRYKTLKGRLDIWDQKFTTKKGIFYVKADMIKSIKVIKICDKDRFVERMLRSYKVK